MRIVKKGEVTETNSNSINNIATIKVVETEEIDKLIQNRNTYAILAAVALFGVLVVNSYWLSIPLFIAVIILGFYFIVNQVT